MDTSSVNRELKWLQGWADAEPTRLADRNNRIRRLRAAGSTLRELAEATGLTKQRISQICNEGNKQ